MTTNKPEEAMTTKTDGGPAFPLPVNNEQCRARVESGYGGISIRDYFAAKAMQGICSANPKATYEEISAFAYRMADAMLKAREVRND